MKKNILTASALLLLSTCAYHTQAADTFEFWQKEQRIYTNQNIAKLATEELIESVRAAATKSKSSYFPTGSSDLKRLYTSLERSDSSFVRQLKPNFSHTSLDKEEAASKHPVTLKKYHTALQSLFPLKNKSDQNQALFNAGNRIFTYCFSEKTFPHFNKLIQSAQHFPLVRFLHATMWTQFCDKGALHWSDECLRNLEELAHDGRTVTYIDGGYDIYQLLKHGIYNIHIINPAKFTPANSEVRKLHLHMTDKSTELVTLIFGKNVITLKRTINRPGRRHRWAVKVNGERKGTIAFEQRAVTQQDLESDNIILCSFRGMANMVKPQMAKGWNLYAGLLPADQKIYVKQLHKPVDKNTLMNLRVAETMNHIDLKFVDFTEAPMQRNYPTSAKGAQ